MKVKQNKKIIGILLGVLSSLVWVSVSLGVTATFYGEVTDDGGDPWLEVWFQYGKTSSYGMETPHQQKYGTGAFSATVSGLEPCTTYHYRAVAKHQNYDDTKYGEDKTFTTPCGEVSVDIKANGSDGPVSIPYGGSVTLSWTSSNANYCYASGDWSGQKATFGSETFTNLTSSKTYTLTCVGAGGSASDSVVVSVQQTWGAVSPTIQKRVRNLSLGQTYFSNSVVASPGDVLEFQIVIYSGSGANNVTVVDVLPNKISMRPDSLKVDGVSTSGNLAAGLSLGNLQANQTKTITFLADLAPAEQFGFGTTPLVNVATLYYNGTSLSASDSATISVRRVGVLGAATAAPTGINGKLISKISLSLLLMLIVAKLMFRDYLADYKEWTLLGKTKWQEFVSKKALQLKIAKERFCSKK